MKQLLFFVLLCISLSVSATDVETESLRYKVTYKGIFSLMKPIDIADIEFQTVSLQMNAATALSESLEFRLLVSSENYGFVERLYPIRYRARSISVSETQSVLAFDRYKKTSKEKLSSYWLGEGAAPIAAIGSWLGESSHPQLAKRSSDRTQPDLDQLGLLLYIRGLHLDDKKQFDISVTTGKAVVKYQVVVEKTEELMLNNRQWPTWKIRLDGVELKDGKEELLHQPVFIWLSRDADRIPLRFENRHSIGRFTIDLVAGDQELAEMSFQ